MLVACGRHTFPDYRPEDPTFEYFEGNYRAEFRSLNQKHVGKTYGHFVAKAKNNQFYVKIKIQNHIPMVHHHQYLHKAKVCPDRRADVNKDGVIDFDEIIKHCGLALIPFDRDLKTRSSGFHSFPMADIEGEYIYTQAASIAKMLNDLRGYPFEPNESFGRLEYGEYLNLDQRVVVVYGNGEDEMFPIACAEIKIDLNPTD